MNPSVLKHLDIQYVWYVKCVFFNLSLSLSHRKQCCNVRLFSAFTSFKTAVDFNSTLEEYDE